jgi:hypothetical protein
METIVSMKTAPYHNPRANFLWSTSVQMMVKVQIAIGYSRTDK